MGTSNSYYIPLICTRAGEMRALRDILRTDTDISRLMPLFEVPPIPWDFESGEASATYVEQASKTALSIKNNWDKSKPAFLDAVDVLTEGTGETKTVVTELFEDENLSGYSLIPVLHGISLEDEPYLSVKKLVDSGLASAVCLRVTADVWNGLISNNELKKFITGLGVISSNCYIILDLGNDVGDTSYIALQSILPTLHRESPDSNFSILATSIPDSIDKGIDEESRVEWINWIPIRQSMGRDGIVVSFGDYGTVGDSDAPLIDPRYMFISGKFKYTTDDSWLLGRGALFKGNKKNPGIGGKAIENVLLSIRANKAFLQNHCETDKWINDVANKVSTSFGNPTSWIQHSMVHHITKVLEQISLY